MEERKRLAKLAKDTKNPYYWEEMARELESAIEEGLVPPDIIDRVRHKAETLRDMAEKIKRHIEEVTGYIWDEKVGWWRDPVTGRFVTLKLEDYFEW